MGPTDLRGVWATVLLPLEANDDIDFGRLEAEVDVLLTTGVHGIYTNGSAGEFHTLGDAEYDRLHDLVATRCRAAGMPFQLGAGHPGGHRSLELIRRAAALEPDAIQVVLPDWLPLTTEEVLAAVDRMARVADGSRWCSTTRPAPRRGSTRRRSSGWPTRCPH
ncbi:dihydrodipicolinate synthase family protein [Actinophytocola sp.]|uniref:dihydrodipicolinate synthase family protein n=1 Tax=Actinophytocola sp. TaxID=1872138 RepID=UPI002ED246F1